LGRWFRPKGVPKTDLKANSTPATQIDNWKWLCQPNSQGKWGGGSEEKKAEPSSWRRPLSKNSRGCKNKHRHHLDKKREGNAKKVGVGERQAHDGNIGRIPNGEKIRETSRHEEE